MLQTAKQSTDWFYEVRGAGDTDVYSNAGLAAEMSEYVGEYGEDQGKALFSQEYECSFEAAILGAFYADALRHMEAEGRIRKIEIDRSIPVHTGWDLGRTDSTAIWFVQLLGREILLVDYYESSGAPLQHYVDKLHELRIKRRWKYGRHWFPHDVVNHELISPPSRIETLRSLGVEVEVVPAHNPLDGINAVRRMLDWSVIDPERCARGLECLKNYRRRWSKENKMWSQSEHKDWTNNGADALRTFAAGYDDPRFKPTKRNDDREYNTVIGGSHWAA
jgi:phage terminase large subunit